MTAENHVNGGDKFSPSRPGLMTFLIGAAVIAAGTVTMNWEAISAFFHLPEIKSSLGL
jgi:hypothetical protein